MLSGFREVPVDKESRFAVANPGYCTDLAGILQYFHQRITGLKITGMAFSGKT